MKKYKESAVVTLFFVCDSLKDEFSIKVKNLFPRHEQLEFSEKEILEKAEEIWKELRDEYVFSSYEDFGEHIVLKIGLNRYENDAKEFELNSEDFLDNSGYLDDNEVHLFIDEQIKKTIQMKIELKEK